MNGEDVRLMLWDTAGQEEFDAITKAYYRGEWKFIYIELWISISVTVNLSPPPPPENLSRGGGGGGDYSFIGKSTPP